MRLNNEDILAFCEIINSQGKYNYVNFGFMPIEHCVFEDIETAYGGNMFTQRIPNFNVCINFQYFMPPHTESLTVCENEPLLLEAEMSGWLNEFSKKLELGADFEYLYFFSLKGDVTLFLYLNEQQLSRLDGVFLDYTKSKGTPLWSFHEVKGIFLFYLADLLSGRLIGDELSNSIALYSLRSRDEIEHRRSCAFSMLPLRLDIMNHFLQQNQFVKPHTRVSFEYKLEEGSYPGELKYGAWADFSCHALELFCMLYNLKFRVFTLTYRKSNSIFVDFYFENDLDTQLSRQLISNFAKGNFGVRLVPDGVLNSELEYVVCHGINELSSEEFVNSLPQENVSFYGLFDLKKRLALRRYSYFSQGVVISRQFLSAFNHMRVLFFHEISRYTDEELMTAENWFKPVLFKRDKFPCKY